MQILRVFDCTVANRLRNFGWAEIKTQFDIKPTVWTFVYDESKPFCFDIDNAMKTGKCQLDTSFNMTF